MRIPLLAALLLVGIGGILHAETATELIGKGDIHYDKLQPAEALKYYLPAEKLEPENATLLVKISRQYRHLMSDASSTAEKTRLGCIAISYAKRAAVLAPEDPEAQLAVAVSYGKLLPIQGNRERIEGQRIIKTAADKVVRLDPRNDLGWHVLGRWHLILADVSPMKRALGGVIFGKLPTGTNEDAVRCFEKAIGLNPTRLMHYIELGRTYAQMGRAEEARKYIKKGLSMRDTEKDDPETKRKGREILKSLG